MQLQQPTVDNTKDNVGKEDTSSSLTLKFVYSLEDDDRPMVTHGLATAASSVENDNNNITTSSSKNNRRRNTLSSSFTDRPNTTQSHFTLPNFMHHRLVRSFDAFECYNNSNAPVELELQSQEEQTTKPIMLVNKQRSYSCGDTEIIEPAPESHTEDDSYYKDSIDDDLELGMVASSPPPGGNNQQQQHTNISFDSEEEEELNNNMMFDCTSSSTRRATRFSNIKAPLSRSLSPTTTSNNSNSNNLDNSHRRVVKLQRQMTQKFQTGFNTLQRQIGSHHLNNKRSLTHQRYNRKSIRDILNSDVGATIHDAKVNGLSEDTIHRVKSGLCCLVFSCGSAALLYFMLKR